MDEPANSNLRQLLRELTPARLALGRTGDSLPTRAWLEFSMAHARARDAVHLTLDVASVQHQLTASGHSSLLVHSEAADRKEFLRRPDAGRRLDAAGIAILHASRPTVPPAVSFVIADGLSARAAERHAVPVLITLAAKLVGWDIAPVIIAQQARVALGDDIAGRQGAELVVVLIGERPGLSAPDSLGAYMTYAPRIGHLDSQRNCVSNIRPEGLSYDQAAHRLAFLLTSARRLRLSGVGLKDQSDEVSISRAAVCDARGGQRSTDDRQGLAATGPLSSNSRKQATRSRQC